MNTTNSLFHLKEALEQLQETITALETGSLEEISFQIEIEHLYHHINTAWNSRDSTEQETNECNKENFSKWQKFPVDLELE